MIFRSDRHGAHNTIRQIGRTRDEQEISAGDSRILHYLAPFELWVSGINDRRRPLSAGAADFMKEA
jgi:L-arabinose isomerase